MVAGGPADDGQGRQGFLLDLVTDTDDDAGSLSRLACAAAAALRRTSDTETGCAVTLHRPGSATLSAGNAAGPAALADAEAQGDGPTSPGALSRSAVIGSTDSSSRWRVFRHRLRDHGYGAALAVPLRLGREGSGSLLFLVPAGCTFSPRQVHEADVFSDVASQSLKLAVDVHGVNRAGDNLREVLEGRTSIDVACGVIMAQNRCSYAEAFGKLASASRQRNAKVRSVAEGILKAVPTAALAAQLEPQTFA
ncbi:GAF and ANTAR domain-containing protein [Arthrobacter sp. C152]